LHGSFAWIVCTDRLHGSFAWIICMGRAGPKHSCVGVEVNLPHVVANSLERGFDDDLRLVKDEGAGGPDLDDEEHSMMSEYPARAQRPVKVLVAWIGGTDLAASGLRKSWDSKRTGLGPIAQVAKERAFDLISLLYNYGEGEAPGFCDWLKAYTNANITWKAGEISGPMDHASIHTFVGKHVDALLTEVPNAQLTYHLSPGTPAMASIWLMLAHTSHPARLVASSPEGGVEDVRLPFKLTLEVVSKAYGAADARLEAAAAGWPPLSAAFEDVIHQSDTMARVLERAQRVALSDVTTLVLGESGTGKELFARAIHKASSRKMGPFVAVNCGAIPSNLIDSELFGHEKGAFTGAQDRRIGVIEQARAGTLFLDEVGELPLDAQVHLLRTLQNKTIRRVGGVREFKVDTRVIAATHRELSTLVLEGHFREDLYYRMAIAVLRIPPLRERGEDLQLLLDHMLEKVREELADHPAVGRMALTPEARKLLLQHSWPGNVRELFNVLMRAALWSRGSELSVEEIQEALREAPLRHGDILDRPIDEHFNLKKLLDEVSAAYIRRALQQTDGNKIRTAQRLGLKSRAVLADWMKRCDVDPYVP